MEQAGEAERYRAYLEGECVETLLRYPEKRKATLCSGAGAKGSVLRKKRPICWGNVPVSSLVFRFFLNFVTRRVLKEKATLQN